MSADKLDLILEKLDSLDKKIDSLDQRVSAMESKIDSTQEMVASIAEDTTDIKKRQDEQEVVLEKLAFRSIEQEAKLDRIQLFKTDIS